MKIDGFQIGKNGIYIIAEIGANHCNNFKQTKQLILAAKEAGVNAVKLQLFHPEDMCVDNGFKLESGLWKGRSLYELYEEIAMPWEWQPRLKHYADEIGITLFSTPFSVSAVDFLEDMDVSCYKVASPEINHIPLLERIGQTKKPVFLSTGCTKTYVEIPQAVSILGRWNTIPLYCVSKYPTKPEDVGLMSIPALSQTYGLHIGFSCHCLNMAIPIASVAMGATVVEVHVKLPNTNSQDSKFSYTPDQLKELVIGIRAIEKARMGVQFTHNTNMRRSVWVTKDIEKGQEFTKNNIAVLRPSGGLHPEKYKELLGKTAKQNMKFGIALNADMI